MSTPPASPVAPSSTQSAGTVRTAPASPKLDRMPPWRVLLHNDDVNDMAYVVAAIVELAVSDRRVAMLRMLEAHTRGCALLMVTHRERADPLHEQFARKPLKVTLEPEA